MLVPSYFYAPSHRGTQFGNTPTNYGVRSSPSARRLTLADAFLGLGLSTILPPLWYRLDHLKPTAMSDDTRMPILISVLLRPSVYPHPIEEIRVIRMPNGLFLQDRAAGPPGEGQNRYLRRGQVKPWLRQAQGGSSDHRTPGPTALARK